MLRKLDRYIIGKYLKTFFFTVFLITIVAVAINYTERVSYFISNDLSFWTVMTEYYLYFIPWINGLLWPLFALIAVIFFTSRLARDTEIVAMLSAGVSYWRILVPYLIGGSIIAGLLWIGNNYVIPKSTKLKDNFEKQYISKNREKTLGTDIHQFIGPDEKIYLGYYRKNDSTGQTFRYEKFKNGKLTYVLKANKLEFVENPNSWKITDYQRRYFLNGKQNFEINKGESFDTIFSLKPEDFVTNEKDMTTMTTPMLNNVITREKERGIGILKKYIIEKYRRTADPFTVIILTIIGVSVSSRKVRGGMGLHLALGVTIGAAFVITSRFCETFAQNISFSPLLGVWLPNIIFSLFAIVLICKAQK